MAGKNARLGLSWTHRRPLLIAGVAAAFAAAFVVAAFGAGLALARGGPGGGGSGGCPSSNALTNIHNDTNLTVSVSVSSSGANASYELSSTNESPSSGVPGLISYCVYPSGTLPANASPIAIGADGSPFTLSTGVHQGYFAFQRANGNPSNLPFNGAANVLVGNATWNASVPSGQSILLHINDPGVCQALYGGNPGTCFVFPTMGTTTCSVPNHAPASLRIPLAPPVNVVPAGATLTASYEVEVANYTPADAGATVYVPAAKIVFPLNGGGEIILNDAAQQISVSGAGWSAPVLQSTLLANATDFSSLRAWLTTVNLAVMVGGGPSSVTLEFRWGWQTAFVGGGHASWSVPSTTASLPNYPSIFLAAPYVGVLSTSGSPVAGGSYFGVDLSGAVDQTWFCITVESTNGHEFHGQVEADASPSAASFSVGLTLTYATTQPLAAGNYLIHIHDAMGAIIIQVAITVT